jgi:hypothetical protein
VTVWRIVIISLFFTVAGALTAKADLTGSSAITLLAEPIPCTLVNEIKLDTPCEKTLLKFDIEALIKFGFSVSGLLFTLDMAVGIPGLEHVILTGNATLGMVDVISELWFATPFEAVTDVNLQPNTVVIPPGNFLFVKKRLTASFSLGGVLLQNLAIFEDVTFPNPGSPYGETDCDGDGDPEGTCIQGIETNPETHYQTQSFAFGNIVTLTGQTPSGITLSSQTGICATTAGNSVKKYSAPGSVNPECVGRVKPQLFFDFETVSISGIQLAPGLATATVLSCVGILGCTLTTTFGLSGGPIPFSTSFTVKDLFTLSFSGVAFFINTGSVSLNVSLDSSFSLNSASIHFSKAITAGNLTAQLSASASAQKGQGVTGATISLSVTSGTFNANHVLTLTRNPATSTLQFGSFSISMGINIAPFRTSLQVAFGQGGLARAGISVGLVF